MKVEYLKSLFLRNSNEPIMDNISERVAFFAGETVTERQSITNRVKKTYGLRSAVVHHRQEIGIDDISTLEEFMLTAWAYMQTLIGYALDGSATKLKLLYKLENIKLAGSV